MTTVVIMLLPGLASVTFRERGAPEIAALAADHGLAVVEWAADRHVRPGDQATAESVRTDCAGRGLRIGTYGSYHKPGASDPAEFAAIAATAAVLGAPRIRVWAGTTGSAQATPAQRHAVVDALRTCADLAAERGLGLLVEHHVESLTDELDSALALHREVDHPAMVRHWQPRELPDAATCRAEVRALRPATVHAFSWGADGYTERLALAERDDVWTAVLAELAGGAPAGTDPEVLLEFVSDDDPAALARDAATLRGWLTELDPVGAR